MGETLTSMKQLIFTSRPLDQVKTDVAIIPVFEDIRPLRGAAGLVDWRLNGYLSQLIMKNRFRGEFEEVLLMPAGPRIEARQLVLFGVGSVEGFGEYLLPAVYRRILNLIANKRDTKFSFCLSDLITEKFEWRNAVRKFVSKLFDYDLDFHVTLCEDLALIQEARRRHMDFGLPLKTLYEVNEELYTAA